MIPLGILASAGAGSLSDYELIETLSLGSNAGAVTFSNLAAQAANYRHLQIRSVTRSNFATNYEIYAIRFNGDATANYSNHSLIGTGVPSAVSNSDVNASATGVAISSGSTNTANNYSPQIIDILDAFSTTKFKTTRTLSGLSDSNREIRFSSGNWRSTNAITSVSIVPLGGTQWLSGSRFSIYGLKG